MLSTVANNNAHLTGPSTITENSTTTSAVTTVQKQRKKNKNEIYVRHGVDLLTHLRSSNSPILTGLFTPKHKRIYVNLHSTNNSNGSGRHLLCSTTSKYDVSFGNVMTNN